VAAAFHPSRPGSTFLNPNLGCLHSLVLEGHPHISRAALNHSLQRTLAMSGTGQELKKRVLVVGGSGRVGGSTVKHLLSEANRDDMPLEVVIGGRSDANFEESKKRIKGKLMDDGIQGALVENNLHFTKLNLESKESMISAMEGMDLVVHTAGPFQQKTCPEVLEAALEVGTSYVDVCDEIELCKAAKALEGKVKEAGMTAIVSAGIWPGASALMAAKAVERLRQIAIDKKGQAATEDGANTKEKLDLSFFTAGTGNAGATIVSATFLLLAQKALTFVNGAKTEVEPWTSPYKTDFGSGVGSRTVRLLDNPDVFTIHEALSVPNIASRFATAPGIWNQLFGAAKAVPDELLSNRDAMQGLSIFSLPIIRAVDLLVGATNSMKVEASNEDASITFTVTHDDLEECVGLATAAFALELLLDRAGSNGAGVFFPAEMSAASREAILERVKRTALVWDWDEQKKPR